MALTPDEREYVVKSVLRILKDANRDEILAALRRELEQAATEEPQGALQLDAVVLAVAQACRPRMPAPRRRDGT